MSDTKFTDRKAVKDHLFSQPIIATTREHYLTKKKTARDTMKDMGVGEWYEGNEVYFARAFNYHTPKGLKRGGKRKNSGRKAGVTYCTGCKQPREACACPPDSQKKVG